MLALLLELWLVPGYIVESGRPRIPSMIGRLSLSIVSSLSASFPPASSIICFWPLMESSSSGVFCFAACFRVSICLIAFSPTSLVHELAPFMLSKASAFPVAMAVRTLWVIAAAAPPVTASRFSSPVGSVSGGGAPCVPPPSVFLRWGCCLGSFLFLLRSRPAPVDEAGDTDLSLLA